MSFHRSLRISAFTTSITQLCVNDEDDGGWSDSWKCGTAQVTGGRSPASMSRARSSMLCCACSFHRSVWKTSSIPLYAFHM